jgi:uncharacterized membrane protein
MALQMKDQKLGMRRVQKTVTVLQPPETLYSFWRDFERLPEFMDHLKSVTVEEGGKRSHWVTKAPLGQSVKWDAEIHEEQENQFIVWRSVPGAQVENVGEVHFHLAPDGRGTEVGVTLLYRLPGGTLGTAVAKMFGEEPSQQLDEDLYRFKQIMETGRIPTTAGQPHGKLSLTRATRPGRGT